MHWNNIPGVVGLRARAWSLCETVREKGGEGRETLRKATVKIQEREKKWKYKIKEKDYKVGGSLKTQNKGRNKNITALVNTLHASSILEIATGAKWL